MTTSSPSRAHEARPCRLPAAHARRDARGPPLARAAALTLLALAAACAPEIQGSGVFREDTRGVPPFSGIKVDDPIFASISIGPEQRVVVSGDANVVMEVEAKVHRDPVRQLPILELRVTDDFVAVHPLRVDVTVPALWLIQAEDAATVSADGLAAEMLEVVASDGASVRLSGEGGALLEVSLSGGDHQGARLDASRYPVELARVALSGGAAAEVLASGAVEGTAAPGSAVENLGEGLCQVTDGQGQPVSCAPR